jgi:plasmid stabilization system protein ParE
VIAAPGEPAPAEIRDWLVGDYVVRYLIVGDGVIVLRVWHGREQRP